jgi:hypothetical protein
MTQPVDNSVRRRNSQAVQKRAVWRVRYAALTESIRMAKQRTKHVTASRTDLIELESMQTMAQIMMQERDLIQMDLVDSAYEWV